MISHVAGAINYGTTVALIGQQRIISSRPPGLHSLDCNSVSILDFHSSIAQRQCKPVRNRNIRIAWQWMVILHSIANAVHEIECTTRALLLITEMFQMPSLYIGIARHVWNTIESTRRAVFNCDGEPCAQQCCDTDPYSIVPILYL